METYESGVGFRCYGNGDVENNKRPGQITFFYKFGDHSLRFDNFFKGKSVSVVLNMMVCLYCF